jgi:hypothetical protein
VSCNCKHNQQEIAEGKKTIAEFRELFIKRMTVDSDHNDRRRKDYNQAIFFYDDYTHEHKQCFCGTNMDMVLQCFDDAVKDWRRTFCDVENCTRR